MPGPQERWDQLTEPSVRSQEATPPDLPRLADRPERGSLAELRQRLERLPAGHPSSPYNDDLTRKLPVTSLKDLELPLHGTERDLNGAPSVSWCSECLAAPLRSRSAPCNGSSRSFSLATGSFRVRSSL